MQTRQQALEGIVHSLTRPGGPQIQCLAASRGVSLQEAVHQALETWASEIQKTALEPLDALEGSLGHVDIENLTRHEREIALVKESRWP